MVITFHKTSMNTELVNSESLLLGDKQGQGRVPMSPRSLSANQFMTLFCGCLCVRTPQGIYVVDALPLNSG